MSESNVEYGPPIPFDLQDCGVRSNHDFRFDLGEPDAFGAEFITIIKDRARVWADQGESRAYMFAVVETGQQAMDDGRYWPKRSNFVDGLLMSASLLNNSLDGDVVLAMLIESIKIPPEHAVA